MHHLHIECTLACQHHLLRMLDDILSRQLSSQHVPHALQVDKDIVKGIIEPARKKFSQQFGDEAPTVQFDSENFLPPPPGVLMLQGNCCCCRRRAPGRLAMSNECSF